MTRTYEEIDQSLLDEKANTAELDGLTSNSSVSIWRLLLKFIAYISWLKENVWAAEKLEFEAIAANAATGTPLWFEAKAKEYQEDDEVIVTNSYKVSYPEGSTGAKIITRSAAKEAEDGRLFLKVAGDNGPITPDQLIKVRGYFKRIKIPIRLVVVSLEADRLRVFGTVYYNPLIPLPTVKASITERLNEYGAKLSYGGTVHSARVNDAIQKAEGVEDLKITQIELRSGATVTTVDRLAETASGWLVEEDAPLSGGGSGLWVDTLTFEPYAEY